MKKIILFALMLALFAFPGALFAGDPPRNEEVKRVDVSKLPLKDAIRIKRGNGAKELIMFTDVDCPFCRSAHEWLKSQTNYTLYIFFHPLNIHKHSHDKSVQILCSKNRIAALNNALSRKDIGSQTCEAGEKMLGKHLAAGRKVGVGVTPTFVTDTGVKISGWGDRARESILRD
ncbi:MAG: DsbC family protein [Syntrophobacteraceae bacterium]